MIFNEKRYTNNISTNYNDYFIRNEAWFTKLLYPQINIKETCNCITFIGIYNNDLTQSM